MNSNSASIHKWNALMRFSGFVCVTPRIYCTHEGSFPILTFFRNKIFAYTAVSSSNALLSFSLCIIQKTMKHIHQYGDGLASLFATRDHSRSLNQSIQNLLLLILFLGNTWSYADDWQDVPVWANWSIIRHMVHWKRPGFIPWSDFLMAPK